MPEVVDKAIISNRAALTIKYGALGVGAIYSKLQDLVEHDKTRGISTAIFDIDDATVMSVVEGSTVVNEKDERGAKTAVDAIQSAHNCDYILLLDGPDVIPHINLTPPAGLNDGDAVIPSDLPYASPAAFSRQVSRYLSVTRVVGRLPSSVGESDPQKLIQLIDHAIGHVAASADNFASHFSISADAWKASTQLSLVNVFGSHNGLCLSPPDGHNGIDPSLSGTVHLINCHGAQGDWKFYGQQGDVYPIAMESSFVGAAALPKGALVAAECCYGAELYNYSLLGVAIPMCLTYLSAGTAAYVGSTNIAYGPAASNAMADLICQYFLEKALKGASTGRAFLEARQAFVQTQVMSTPQNAKTLAQFNLYGDPSLVPVTPTVEDAGDMTLTKSMADTLTPRDEYLERKARRLALESNGRSVAALSTKTTAKISELETNSLVAVSRFKELATKMGMDGAIEVYGVSGGAEFRRANKGMEEDRKIAVTVREGQRTLGNGAEAKNVASYKVVIGHILRDGIFQIDECESK